MWRAVACTRMVQGQQAPYVYLSTPTRSALQRSQRITHRSTSTTSSNKSQFPAKRPSIQKEKLERAKQIHTELEELMHQQQKRAQQEKAIPIYNKIGRFFTKFKQPIFNVAAAFGLTLLAYQVVVQKERKKIVQRKLDQKNRELEQKNQVLKALTSDAFIQELSEQCHQATGSNSWMLSRSSSNNDDLTSVLQEALKAKIGTKGLTAKEKRDMETAKLQEAQEELLALAQLGDAISLNDGSAPDLETKVEVVRDTSSGATLERKQKFSI